jgi:hypothetical protein
MLAEERATGEAVEILIIPRIYECGSDHVDQLGRVARL